MLMEKYFRFQKEIHASFFENQIRIAQDNNNYHSQWKFVSLDPLRLLSTISLTGIETLTHINKKVRTSKNIFEKDHAHCMSKLICDIIAELDECKGTFLFPRSIRRSGERLRQLSCSLQ